jgi:hypothetical protein
MERADLLYLFFPQTHMELCHVNADAFLLLRFAMLDISYRKQYSYFLSSSPNLIGYINQIFCRFLFMLVILKKKISCFVRFYF